MLDKCLANGIKKAGMLANWTVYDNAKAKNIGLNAYAYLTARTTGDYIVTVDEDVIDFSENWLLNLWQAYQLKLPNREWGWLGADTIKNEKTNGALWPDWIEETRILTLGQHEFYIDKQIPQTCAIVSREIYNKVGGFPISKEKVFNIDAKFGRQIDKAGYAQGIYRNVQVYHACGPYFYRNYPELWQEKQGESLKKSEKKYYKRDNSLTVYK